MQNPNQFLIYQSEDGSTRIDVTLEAETLWLNQKQLTELFGKAKGTISEHIRHIRRLQGFCYDARIFDPPIRHGFTVPSACANGFF